MTTTSSPVSEHFRWPTLALLGLLGVFLSGCGSSVERGRIFGKVTFQGQPVAAGMVSFACSENGVQMSADIKPDGSYEVITTAGAGLPLGTYRVSVCPPLVAPVMMPGPATKAKEDSNIPEKYRHYDTAGLTLTVKQGKNPFDIELKL